MSGKIFLKMALSFFLLFMTGCSISDSPESEQPNTPVNPALPLHTNSIPILQMNNWWKYTDGAGHHLSINVVDTLTDNSVTYYKLVFAQQAVDTVNDWFVQNSSGTQYGGNSVLGPYKLFLPAQLNSVTGHFLISDSSAVNYAYSDSMSYGKSLFRYVIQLAYQKPLYHKFNELDMADSIGIVRMVDTADQVFPLIYQIDSSFVTGKIKRY